MIKQNPSFSIVVPVYGCVNCLEALCTRLTNTLNSLTDQYEIILVDDRSPDEAWDMIIDIQTRFSQVKGIRLSRNYGQQHAISAGLAEARGEYAVVMDCDLQDPPEKIPELFAKIGEGYDLVLARRIERQHSFFRRMAARVYFWLMTHLTEEHIDGDYGAFSILSRKVIDGFLRFNDQERHYLFILRWLGFNIGSIDYKHAERAAGESSYTLGRLLKHSFSGLFFQSTVLLRWIVTIGLVFALGGIGLALFFVYRYFVYGSVAGWTSVVVLILISTGVILMSLGVIGLYIGKIFDQVKERPLYVVDTVLDRSDQW